MPKYRNPMVAAIGAIIDKTPEHRTTGSLRGVLNQLRMRAEALDGVHANRSPLDTPAAHALKVAKMARTFDRQVTETINQASQNYGQSLAALDSRIADKINLKPDAFAAEVRAVFRGLKDSDKLSMLQELVEGNRGPELAAIVKAPATVTGLAEQHRAAFEGSIVAKHAAPELEEREQLAEMMESITAATSAAGRYVKELTDPSKLAEIEREDAAAIAAGDAFNASMSGG